MNRFIARWGYLVAAAVFLAIAVLPTQGTSRTIFLVLAMVFFVIGAAAARKHSTGNG